jgi:hypothetical protein
MNKDIRAALMVARRRFADGGAPDDQSDMSAYGPNGPMNQDEAGIAERQQHVAELTSIPNYPGDKLEAPMGYLAPARASSVRTTDAGVVPIDESGNELQWIKRPGVVPAYYDPSIKSIRPAMPAFADIAGNVTGAPIGQLPAAALAAARASDAERLAPVVRTFLGPSAQTADREALELFNPSGEYKNQSILHDPTMTDNQGSYFGNSKGIEAYGPTIPSIEETVAHEFQHAVPEAWTRGGDPDSKEVKDFHNRLMTNSQDIVNRFEPRMDNYVGGPDKWRADNPGAAKAYDDANYVLTNIRNPFDLYQHIKGEAYARAAAERRGMSLGELSNTPVQFKTDSGKIIPPDKLIPAEEIYGNKTPDVSGSVPAPAPRQVNDAGLYSAGAEAAANLPQMRGTPQQFRAMLEKQGVKPAEFENSGYDQAFAGKNIVTKDDVAQHFQNAQPKINEKVLAGPTIGETWEDSEDLAYSLSKNESLWDRFRDETGEDLPDFNEFRNSDERLDHLSDNYPDHINNLVDSWNEEAHEAAGDTKYQDYTIPGGENYREVLLQSEPKSNAPKSELDRYNKNKQDLKEGNYWPNEDKQILGQIYDFESHYGKPQNYLSGHWDEPNVVAHLRMSDRPLPEGGKGLHLEELQSDWGQEGRKKGFRDQSTGSSNELSKIPSAPYVTSTQGWTDLGLKRALKEAAEGGYDKFLWTPGAEQADRYNLSKQIETLAYDPDKKKLTYIQKGRMGWDNHPGVVEPKDLPGIIGKEASEKLLNAKPDPSNGNHVLRGADLSFGGEGLKGYYDKIVPARLKELTKKLDPSAKIELNSHQLPTGEKLHSLEITPLMRERIKKGLPAFKSGGAVAQTPNIDKALALTRFSTEPHVAVKSLKRQPGRR